MLGQQKWGKLQYIANAMRLKSQKSYSVANFMQYLLVGLSMVTLFLPETIGWIFLIIACIVELIISFLNSHAEKNHQYSREALRLLLIHDSMNTNFDQLSYEYILNHFNAPKESQSSFINPTYYSTDSSSGNTRFAHNSAESIFYTKSIMQKSHKNKKIKLIIFCLTFFFVILLTILLWHPASNIFIVTPITAILGYILYSEIAQLIHTDRALRKLDYLDNKLSQLITDNNYDLLTLMNIYTEYSIAVSSARPVSTKLYKQERDSIREQWKERQEYLRRTSAEEESILSRVEIYDKGDSIPTWLSKKEWNSVLASLYEDIISPQKYGKLLIKGLQGNSSSYTVSLDFQGEANDIILLIKFYPNLKEYKSEKDRLYKYSAIRSECFSKYYTNTILEKYNALALYHINNDIGSDYLSMHQVMEANFTTTPNDYLYDVMGRLPRMIDDMLDVFNSQSPTEKDAQSELKRKLILKKPCRKIIDISDFSIFLDNNILKFEGEPECENTEYTVLNEDPYNSIREAKYLSWRDNTKVVCKITYQEEPVLIFLPIQIRSLVPDVDSYTIDLKNLCGKRVICSTQTYLEMITGGSWTNLDLTALYEKCSERFIDDAQNIVIVHNDFHYENLFVSKESYKVLDLYDVGPGFFYTDVARIQVSLLHFLLSKSGAKRNVQRIINALMKEKKNGNNIFEALFDIPNQMTHPLKKTTTNNEYLLTFLQEIIIQAYYSVCSHRPVPTIWITLIEDLTKCYEQNFVFDI